MRVTQMTPVLKRVAHWTVFSASATYGLWSFGKLFSVLFNLGENESALATLSILVFGLVPLPASFLALRWRKTAALMFCGVAIVVATLFTHGNVGKARLMMFVCPPLIFAAFYLVTDILRW